MAIQRSGYSRFVQVLKILLPLVALVLISTLFLFARNINFDRDNPVPGIDLPRLIAQSGIGSPKYSGQTEDGALIQFSADRVSTIAGQLTDLRAEAVTLEITEQDGRKVRVTAPTAAFSDGKNRAWFDKGAVVTGPDGWHVTAGQLDMSLRVGEVNASGGINVDGPLGEFTAKTMKMTRKDANAPESGFQTLFEGGVKLIYHPPK